MFRCGTLLALVRAMSSRTNSLLPAGLASGSAIIGAGFAALTVRTARHKTTYIDGRARAKVPKRKKKETKAVAVTLGRFGKVWMQTPVGLLIAADMARRGAKLAATVVASTSVLSYALSESFDYVLPHRSPPPGRRSPTTPSFPSGHTLRTTAVMSIAAYVASRERIVDWRAVLLPGVLLGPLSGLDRVYLDRHWATDAIAGWLCGVSLAAVAAAAYEIHVE